MAPLFDINFEVQHGGLAGIAFLRGAVAGALPGSGIEMRGDPIAVPLGEVGHAVAHRGVPRARPTP